MARESTGAVAAKWNRQSKAPRKRTNYWQFPEICAHLNRKICGKPLPKMTHGMHRRLRALGPFARGVSVGCGRGTKENALLQGGIVERMDCFDLADQRLAETRKLMEASGVIERAKLVCGDAFDSTPTGRYDLVYWHSSLHHMMDTRAAIEWGFEVLKPGGVFAMREYTGPTRWQLTDRNLQRIAAFRGALPAHLKPKQIAIERRSVEWMIERDPSEAADSGNILPALRDTFPDAEVIPLGGALYVFGLQGILPRVGAEDAWFFDMAMAYDDALLDEGLVTAAFARKPG